MEEVAWKSVEGVQTPTIVPEYKYREEGGYGEKRKKRKGERGGDVYVRREKRK